MEQGGEVMTDFEKMCKEILQKLKKFNEGSVV
jgi:hypothetical protein